MCILEDLRIEVDGTIGEESREESGIDGEIGKEKSDTNWGKTNEDGRSAEKLPMFGDMDLNGKIHSWKTSLGTKVKLLLMSWSI